MTGYSSRQSVYTIGDTINAADSNDEFDALLTAFGTTGHNHDGTAGDGGALSKLTGSNAITIGAATAGTDITVTFDGESNDGVLLWMEDEDYFKFNDDIMIIDNENIIFGTDSNILIGYDETTSDSLRIKAAEGAGLAITLCADEGDDAGDEWKLNIADGGVFTLGNDINSAGTYVTHMTLTPHATVASSVAAFAGGVTIAGDLTITGDDLTMGTNTSGHIMVADGTNFNPVAVSGDVTMAASGAITIANGAVENAMLADDAVGADELADDAVGAAALADDAVGADALAANAVVNASVASSAAIAIAKTALVAGTNITLATNTLNVDDSFLVNSGDDATSGVITSAGYKANVTDGSGDVSLAFQQGGTTGYVMGIDDSDSNKFKIHSATALADTSDFEMDASGNVTIAGSVTLTTDLTVPNGGTGASTFTDGGVLLGSGTGAITAMAVLTDGQMIVGDGTTDPVAESGATLRTSIGLGSIATQAANSVSISGGTITGITDLVVADGGTGASTFTDGGVLLGSGTGAITAMAVLGDGEMIVGDGTTDPVAESGATLRTSIGLGTMAVVNTNAVSAQTLAGAITGADQTVSAINLKDYGEITQTLGSAGGTRTVNLNNGNSATATVSSSTNTFVFSNPTASDELCGFTLELTNGGSQTVNWPASVDWAAATAPTLTESGVDYLVFWTVNGGTRWYGGLVGAAFA